MEPQPGHHPETPQQDQQNGAKLENLGSEIEEGVAELAGGLVESLRSFAHLFGVHPDNPQELTKVSSETQEPPLP